MRRKHYYIPTWVEEYIKFQAKKYNCSESEIFTMIFNICIAEYLAHYVGETPKYTIKGGSLSAKNYDEHKDDDYMKSSAFAIRLEAKRLVKEYIESH